MNKLKKITAFLILLVIIIGYQAEIFAATVDFITNKITNEITNEITTKETQIEKTENPDFGTTFDQTVGMN